MPRTSAPRVECPVCEFPLRGTPQDGYRCARCHARYSTRFVRGLRRQAFSARIEAHFSPVSQAISLSSSKRSETVEDTIVAEVAPSLLMPAQEPPGAAAPEGEDDARDAPESLDDFLDLEEAFSQREHAPGLRGDASVRSRLHAELHALPLYAPSTAMVAQGTQAEASAPAQRPGKSVARARAVAPAKKPVARKRAPRKAAKPTRRRR